MENFNVPLQAVNQEVVARWLGGYWWVVLLLVIWTMVWKGLALWKAARAHSKSWFILILILNTVGILEIIYYFLVDNKKAK